MKTIEQVNEETRKEKQKGYDRTYYEKNKEQWQRANALPSPPKK